MSDNVTKIQKNAELIFSYIYNNRMIFISAFILIIVIIAGILVYRMNIERGDRDTNADFESALALYGMIQSARIPREQLNNPTVMAEIITRFQRTYNAAKGRNLKLRAAYSLGSAYYDIGNYTESSKYFKEVADVRNFYLQEGAIYNLANSQIEATNYAEAISTLENFIMAYPDSYLNPQATLTLSDLYRKNNDRTKSLGVLRNWLNGHTNDTHYFSVIAETVNLIENNVY